MQTLNEHYAGRFLFNNELYRTNTKGFDEMNSRVGPPGGGNSAAWIAGHLVASRLFYLKVLGATVADTGEFARYRRGSKSDPEGGFLPLDEVTARYVELGHELAKHLGGLSVTKLDEPGPADLPGVKTLADAIAFFHMHECYHLGQIGLARRISGLAGAIA